MCGHIVVGIDGIDTKMGIGISTSLMTMILVRKCILKS